METRKQNDTKTRRRKEQRSSNSPEDNGNHTEETHVDHLKSHLMSEPSKKMERNGINVSDGAKRR
jgi:hypothetical protein